MEHQTQQEQLARIAESHVNVGQFAGRLGGNGGGILPDTDSSKELLERVPDAAPLMTFAQQFDLRPFRTPELWKAALMEGVGTTMFVWITIYSNSSPLTEPYGPTAQLGVFNTASFLGPLVGSFLIFVYLTLFIFCFGGVTGAHLNPTLTFATFFARLSSFPRTVLYVAFQTAGGALGGVLARLSIGTRDFKAGGCYLFPDQIDTGDAFVIEFMATLLLLFFAFGVGIDPRQREIVGPTLGPFLVGMAVGSVSLGSAFARVGFGGASTNPARCFGVFVGSHFPRWHWINWIADIAAGIVHAVFYHIVPPWNTAPQ
ncbi:putative aquaporin transporter [Microdochium trichocladiopsis]|uniref:Aquaporin transporter n=1 Tax=Microdochium trichocladiopsis TaxID=1682393 RepID=A0A9P8Y1K1_9PEZI|nr:putative aquaporin transporter [Microdochium trichocladiopsis]KAH7027199.1 putative aquaporin transporter [Microdochium trichocladiopsis]